jgi:hypothetical protein
MLIVVVTIYINAVVVVSCPCITITYAEFDNMKKVLKFKQILIFNILVTRKERTKWKRRPQKETRKKVVSQY